MEKEKPNADYRDAEFYQKYAYVFVNRLILMMMVMMAMFWWWLGNGWLCFGIYDAFQNWRIYHRRKYRRNIHTLLYTHTHTHNQPKAKHVVLMLCRTRRREKKSEMRKYMSWCCYVVVVVVVGRYIAILFAKHLLRSVVSVLVHPRHFTIHYIYSINLLHTHKKNEPMIHYKTNYPNGKKWKCGGGRTIVFCFMYYAVFSLHSESVASKCLRQPPQTHIEHYRFVLFFFCVVRSWWSMIVCVYGNV